MFNMAEPRLPIEIEDIILEELSHLTFDPSELEWRTTLSCLCVCRRWRETLQELLLRHNAAITLLKRLGKIGQLAVQRAAAAYAAARAQSDDGVGTSAGAEISQCQRLQTRYLSWNKFYGEDLATEHVADDLKRCAGTARAKGDVFSLRTCIEAGGPYGSVSWMLLGALDRSQTDIAKFLLEGDHLVDQRGYLLGRLTASAVYQGKSEFVEIFLDHGADVDTINCQIPVEGRYHPVGLVSYAALHNHVEVLRVLFSRGFGVEDPAVKTRPLHWAIKHDNVEMMEVFIQHGAILNPRENGEDWPLLWAVQEGGPEMVRLLLHKTGLPRWGSHLRRVLSHAVQDRGSDEIKQVVALHKNIKWPL
ncbi:ankyrin repeat-containing domain protein, partial [Aspergillus pseudoustus]